MPTDPVAGHLRDIALRFHRSVAAHVKEAAPYLAEMGVPSERASQTLALIGSIISDDRVDPQVEDVITAKTEPTPAVKRAPKRKARRKAKAAAKTKAAAKAKAVEIPVVSKEDLKGKSLIQRLAPYVAAALGSDGRMGNRQIASIVETIPGAPMVQDLAAAVLDTVQGVAGPFHKVARRMWRMARPLTEREEALRLMIMAPLSKAAPAAAPTAVKRPNKKAEFERYLQKHKVFTLGDVAQALKLDREPTSKILSRAKTQGIVTKNPDGNWCRAT